MAREDALEREVEALDSMGSRGTRHREHHRLLQILSGFGAADVDRGTTPWRSGRGRERA